jgi:hypothetical protein
MDQVAFGISRKENVNAVDEVKERHDFNNCGT